MASDETRTVFRSTADGAQQPRDGLERGALVGRFVVLHPVGRGASGEVYAAYDPQLERKVAIKLLHSDPHDDRLVQEAQAMARLRHPNVVTVYDLGESDGRLFFSMAYIEGQNLADLLAQRSSDRSRAVEIGRQIADGLAAAHKLGILHRDLKPANVVIDGEGEVLITDFGLAGLKDAEVQTGTPAYMAPEQRVGVGVSAKSDVYSLGWVLYELFTGAKPSVKRCLRTPPDAVPGLDPATELTVLRCLAMDPDERPSARELAGALAGARVALERSRQRRRQLGAVAAAVFLFVGAMSYQTHQLALAARRARDVARVAVAGEWMAKDATTAALVLLEIERPDEVPLARSKMRTALGQPLADLELRGHRDQILQLRWSPDGRHLVTASLDGTARIWRADGSGHRVLRHDEALWSASWSPDGTLVLTTTDSGAATLWPTDAGRPHHQLAGHEGRIWSVDWSPDGRRLVTASDDGTGPPARS